MDKIAKALKVLSPREQKQVKEILQLLRAHRTTTLDIKKLKGRHDIFRVRKGTIRIIYRIANKQIFILAIERRSDTTYH